jgi:glycosyltransferase involved in cell wall biosynthesis
MPEYPQTFLLLTHTAVLGGSSRSLSLVIRHLAESGSKVYVFSPEGPAWDAWKSGGAEVIRWEQPVCNWLGTSIYSTYAFESSWDRLLLNAADLLLLPARLQKAKKQLRNFISSRSVSAIYVNSLALFPLAATIIRLKQKTSVQVIWQIREVLNEDMVGVLYRSIASAIAKASDDIIAISTNEANAFKDLKRVEILYNSVSPDWGRTVSVIDTSKKNRTRCVAMSGAYRPSKGVADFIQMAQVVKAAHPDVEFHLYSPHPIPPRYRRLFGHARRFFAVFSEKIAISLDLVESLNSGIVNGCVHVFFDKSLSLDSYGEMTVYVRSDRSGSPWGRDVIEAMWAGVPVVATGTNQEFILDGETGFLVLPGNPQMIADRVCKILDDESLLSAMSSASRQRARILFDPYEYGQRLTKLFKVKL